MQSDDASFDGEDDDKVPSMKVQSQKSTPKSPSTKDALPPVVRQKSTTDISLSKTTPERKKSVAINAIPNPARRKSVAINATVSDGTTTSVPIGAPSNEAAPVPGSAGAAPAERRKSVSINAPERRRSTIITPSTKDSNSRKNSSFHNFYKNVFVSDTILAQSLAIQEDHSVDESTHVTFTERDFKLPELEVQIGMDLNDILLHERHKKQLHGIRREIAREHTCLNRLDDLAQTTDDKLASQLKKGAKLSASATRKLRVKLECEAELATIRQIVTRKPGELTDKLKAMKEQIESESLNGIDDDQRESSIDHPALDSVHEKMEDLRQEECERWCHLRAKRINEKYTNLEKRMLRKWFKELDYDGSGEVNVEELQDPMLSSGILKTREQVVRVLANVDKNGTMGIDFEEFLVALGANKLADKSKLKKLQEMSAHPFFDVDTLITAERRKKLFKSIIKQCQLRQTDIDKLYKKYDKPKLTRKERDMWARELDELEEAQSRSIFLHSKYLHALDGVLEDKKEFYAMQRADRERLLEENRPRDALDTLMSRPGYHLQGTVSPHASTDSLSGLGLGIAGGSHAGSHHSRHLAHLHSHLSHASHDTNEHTPGRHGEQVEVLRNPYSIYAPPTPKYNNKKKIDIYA